MSKQVSFVQRTENKIAQWSDRRKTLTAFAILGGLWLSLCAGAVLLCTDKKQHKNVPKTCFCAASNKSLPTVNNYAR